MKDLLLLAKQILKTSAKKVKVLTGAAIATGVLAATVTTLAGWSPDRPVYDWNKTEDRVGSLNGPRMNAFINTPFYGDERAFFDACAGDYTACASSNGGVFKDVLSEPTKSGNRIVTLRTYVHNGANQDTNESGVGVAKDAKVRIDLPTGTEQALRMRSYISISNAAEGYPNVVTDTTELVDGTPFSISYVPGSAKIYTAVHENGVALSDNIVSDGATIGYDAINGNVPGCFEFQAIVTIQVEIEVPDHEIEKVVRKAGTTEYGELATVKPGENVQWRIYWKNTGDVKLEDVAITDQLPPHMTLVPGSVRWIYRASDGTDRDEVQPDNDLFTKWVNFGDWEPTWAFYLRFDTTAKDDFEGCEATVRNLVHAHNEQLPNDKTDTADVKIVKENCVPPQQPPKQPPAAKLPVTGPESTLGIFAGTSALGYAIHRLRTLRKIR